MDTFQDGSPFDLHPPGTDFGKMWQEARCRWLRPSEIYDVLTNHFRFSISKEPLNLPPSGTLVLFDRKMLRNFRRDGHPWRKKKDNKTVKEAHEHLKVGSEEKIHVYYAHGDGESNLQRRVYWLLDKAVEHIVLVHYLEVKEVVKTNTFLRQPTSMQSMQHGPITMYQPSPSSYFTGVEPVPSSGSSAGPASTPPFDVPEYHSNESDDFDKFYFEDLRSTGETGFGNTSLEAPWLDSLTCQQMNYQVDGNLNTGPQSWDTVLQIANNAPKLFGYRKEQFVNAMQLPMSDNSFQDVVSKRAPNDSQSPYENQVYAREISSLSMSLENSTKTEDNGFCKRESSVVQGAHSAELSLQMPWLENSDEVLKKLDSLDRWMQRELPVESRTSPLAPSASSCSVLDTPMYEDKTREDGTQLALQSPVTEEMTPTFSPQLFFEITDYSPTSSFSSENAKVIITGHFNGDAADFDKIHWCCMFGGKEILAEVVQLGVLRCKTPKDAAPGKVSFYITDGSKQICSDVKHFELLESPVRQKLADDARIDQDYEDARLQHRLACLLLGNNNHSNANQKSQESTSSMPSMFTQLTNALEQEWLCLNDLLNKRSNALSEVKELLLQMVLKCTMVGLISKQSAICGKSWKSFDSSGQSALHLASALGYEWVINILKASGTSIDFRDKRGWTALHWAAHYGREKMVAALLAAGARPGTITDPTPENKLGCTPADVAALAGYDGLAGYLSEQDLASHLKALTLTENERDKQSADDEGHRVVEYLKRSMSLRRSIKTVEDELALEDSLTAIGNATTVSARIHAAFREYFMRERLQAIEEVDEYGISVEEQMAVQKIQRAYRNHRERKIKANAALQIQNRFRVWKTRKNFLNIRHNVIKIQAYYRMHKARKQYHKILWSVGVLEKAVLRWRQRRKGLRGYQAEETLCLEGKDKTDFLTIGRKQAEDSLDRAVLLVQSMVRSRLAREQYRRMKENFERAKATEYSSQAVDQTLRQGDIG